MKPVVIDPVEIAYSYNIGVVQGIRGILAGVEFVGAGRGL